MSNEIKFNVILYNYKNYINLHLKTRNDEKRNSSKRL